MAAPGNGDGKAADILELSAAWYWEMDAGLTPTDEMVAAFRDAYLPTLLARQPFRDLQYSIVNGKGEVRYIQASGKPLFDAKEEFRGYRGVAKDVTETVLGEKLLRLEHAITRCIAEAENFSAAIEAVIRTICESEGWECGDYWWLDRPAGKRRLLHSWGVDSPAIRHFQEQSRGLVLPAEEGNVGMVLASGQPFWNADMASSGVTARARIAREADLHALFILPIVADETTLAAISFNSRRIREPDARLLQAMRVIGNQVGQYLQRRQAEEGVRESEERFRSLVKLSSDTYWEQDDEYRFTVSSAFDLAGTASPRQRVIGRKRWENDYLNMTQRDWDEHIALLDARKPFRDLELCFLNDEKRKVWFSVSGEPVFHASGTFKGYRGIGKEVTARKEAEEQIQYLAHHDGLTGLPNRAMFGELLTLAVQQGRRYERRFAVMFIDLDRFKIINDTLGHEAGDLLLKEISDRLRRALRSSDVIARLGGDEFVVLVQEVEELRQVEAVAGKLLSALARPLTILGQEFRVTGSIGICMFPADAQDEEALMKHADIAMYQAKEAGKNDFRFYSDRMRTDSFERLALETSLRLALEREEFVLHYQAKLDLKTGGVTGVEALLRWQHPELGLVAPAKFISLAEETGLIVPIGRWIFRQVCTQSIAWQRAGLPPLRMAVNLSPRQFSDEALVDDIECALAESGLKADLLELEISESMVMQNLERTTRVLAAVKELGVRLAIDNFGVGYSSLAMLKRFPFDTLKVDRSFIRNLAAGSDDRAITEAVIAMGRTLSLTVVAEGVETQEQRTFLQQHDCDEMQGFYFNKPAAEADFAAFLRGHLAR